MTQESGLHICHRLFKKFPQVHLSPQQGGLHAAPKEIVGQTGATTRLEANTKKGCGNEAV